MKTTTITPWLVRSESSYWGEYLFVEVATDEGVSGWGEVTTTTKPANRAICAILSQIGPTLAGEDPAHIEHIWNKLFRAFTYMGSRGAACNCISAIDIALWDIRGKVLGLPIYELLGGPVRDDVLLYTHPDQSKFTDEAGVRAEIRAIVDSGHSSIKFDPFAFPEPAHRRDDGYRDGKLSRKAEREAAELTALIRDEAGQDTEILIDAHGRFNVPTAIRLCRALEEAADIDWFEEPVPVESYHALQQVRDKVSAGISIGERLHTRWEFVPIFENELADFVMPDVTWTGGISELKKIATMAEAYYIPIAPHDASGPINVVAGAQVMMTVPNFHRLETSCYDLSAYDVFITEPLDNAGGALKLPRKPGLGIEMNMDYMRANVLEGTGAE